MGDNIQTHVGNYLRYLVNVIYDSQDLNQGCFLAKRGNELILCGLEKKLSVREVQEIGINNLAQVTRAENKFVRSVREYRALDLSKFRRFQLNLYMHLFISIYAAQVGSIK